MYSEFHVFGFPRGSLVEGCNAIHVAAISASDATSKVMSMLQEKGVVGAFKLTVKAPNQ
ncbi:hypothetical protein C7374_11455 [Falsochrobactrum ovis]|uniref:Uncharacterized protein n=1 Tax=Falsochrobactrum ovis TaxID=1293442 RepID=A0A364JT60_9HYPH|nr:hypothetical protein C7374_11455 [Falsochrobactrum ovis]